MTTDRPDPRVIEPGRIKVVLIRKVVPADDASRWPCTRCGRQVHPAESFWLAYQTPASEVPYIVPVCDRCVDLFEVEDQPRPDPPKEGR